MRRGGFRLTGNIPSTYFVRMNDIRRGRAADTPALTTTEDDADTKERLLKTALRLFSESGFDAVSIRAITSEAGANLGAIGYHYGSKDGLIRAVFERLARPVNDRRLISLEAYEREAAGEALPVERVVRALVEPAVRFAMDPNSDGIYFSRILNIAIALRPPGVMELIRGHYDHIARRFISALTRALPNVAAEDIVWRYVFAIGAMINAIDDGQQLNRVKALSNGLGDSGDPDQLIEELVPFVVGAFTAPSKRRSQQEVPPTNTPFKRRR